MIVQIVGLKVGGVLKGDPVGVIGELVPLSEIQDEKVKNQFNELIGILHLSPGDYIIIKNPLQAYHTIHTSKVRLTDQDVQRLIQSGKREMVMWEKDASGKNIPYLQHPIERLDLTHPSFDQDEVETIFRKKLDNYQKLMPDKNNAEILQEVYASMTMPDNYYLVLLKGGVSFRAVRDDVAEEYRQNIDTLKNFYKKKSIVTPNDQEIQQIAKTDNKLPA